MGDVPSCLRNDTAMASATLLVVLRQCGGGGGMMDGRFSFIHLGVVFHQYFRDFHLLEVP